MDRVGDRTIGKMLLSTFQMRYKDILTKAHTAAHAVASKFLAVLTKEETNCEIPFADFSTRLLFLRLICIWNDDKVIVLVVVYEAAQSSMAAFKKWRIGGPRIQRASVLGRKRKPID